MFVKCSSERTLTSIAFCLIRSCSINGYIETSDKAGKLWNWEEMEGALVSLEWLFSGREGDKESE